MFKLLVEIWDLPDGPSKKRILTEDVVPLVKTLWAFEAKPGGFLIEEIVISDGQLEVTDEGIKLTAECFGATRELKVLDSGWGPSFEEVKPVSYGAMIIKAHADHIAEAEHKELAKQFGKDWDS